MAIAAGRNVLPHHAALELGHAFLAQVGTDSGTRLLFFKGLSAIAGGFRPTNVEPADVDVYVDPRMFDEFVDRLAAMGFRARFVPSDEPRFLPYHSATLVHARWPCDFDLHHYIPGLFANSADVFDAMWRRHGTAHIAGVDVPVPSQADHAVILSANATRDPRSAHAASDLRAIAGLLASDPDLSSAFVAARDEFRSAWALRRFSQEYKLDTGSNDLTPDEAARWDLLVEALNQAPVGGGLVAYVYRFRSAGWRERLHIVRLTLWKPTPQLQVERPGQAKGRLAGLRLHVARGRRGFAQLPTVLHAMKTLRQLGIASTAAPDAPPATNHMLDPRGLDALRSSPTPLAQPAPSRESSTHPAIHRDFVFSHAPVATCETTAGTAVMPLSRCSGLPAVTLLNGSASEIWDALDGWKTGHDIAETLANQYNISIQSAEHDVRALLEDLSRKQLTQTAEAVPGASSHGSGMSTEISARTPRIPSSRTAPRLSTT